jgi:hypothetical protein
MADPVLEGHFREREGTDGLGSMRSGGWLSHYATVRKVRVRVPMRLLIFFFSIYLIILAALWPRGLLILIPEADKKMFLGSRKC